MLTFLILAGAASADPSGGPRLVIEPAEQVDVALERIDVHRDRELQVQGPAVTHAGKRLTVPQYLMMVDRDRADALVRRIERNRGASTALGAIGAMGFAAVMAGNLGQHLDESERHGWHHVRTTGFVTGLVGLAGSLLTSRTAQRLTHDFTATQDRTDTLETVRLYNASVQPELGIRPVSEPSIWAPPQERTAPPRTVLRRK